MSELKQYYCEDADHIKIGKKDQIIRLGDESRLGQKLRVAKIIKYSKDKKGKKGQKGRSPSLPPAAEQQGSRGSVTLGALTMRRLNSKAEQQGSRGGVTLGALTMRRLNKAKSKAKAAKPIPKPKKMPAAGTYNYIVMGTRLYMYEQNSSGDAVAKITPTKAQKLGLPKNLEDLSLQDFKDKVLDPDSGLSPDDIQAIFSERIGHAYLAKVCAIDAGHPEDTRVIGAGEIIIHMGPNGVTARITNSSGHYLPNGSELPYVKELFKEYTGLTRVTISNVRSASRKRTKARSKRKKTKARSRSKIKKRKKRKKTKARSRPRRR
jgi:hypothetical protein